MSETNFPQDPIIAEHIHAPIEAVLQQDGSEWTLIIRRDFSHSPERVWQMLTDPAWLARWSPVVPDRPLTTVGPATSRENPGDEPVDAEVLIANEPHQLVHHWGEDTLSWTVARTETGSTLELRQSLTDHSYASMLAAGWQVCLGRLSAEDDEVEHERVVGERAFDYGFQALYDGYRESLGSD